MPYLRIDDVIVAEVDDMMADSLIQLSKRGKHFLRDLSFRDEDRQYTPYQAQRQWVVSINLMGFQNREEAFVDEIAGIIRRERAHSRFY